MEITKDIPAKTGIPHSIRRIGIDLVSLTGSVYIDIPGEPLSVVNVELMPIMTAATTTQKNAIKGFIKTIIAQAMEIDAATVPSVLEEP